MRHNEQNTRKIADKNVFFCFIVFNWNSYHISAQISLKLWNLKNEFTFIGYGTNDVCESDTMLIVEFEYKQMFR